LNVLYGFIILSPHKVQQIWQRFQQQGEQRLAPHYERCGHLEISVFETVISKVGGGIISVNLQ
jgi:hypothetical protein